MVRKDPQSPLVRRIAIATLCRSSVRVGSSGDPHRACDRTCSLIGLAKHVLLERSKRRKGLVVGIEEVHHVDFDRISGTLSQIFHSERRASKSALLKGTRAVTGKFVAALVCGVCSRGHAPHDDSMKITIVRSVRGAELQEPIDRLRTTTESVGNSRAHTMDLPYADRLIRLDFMSADFPKTVPGQLV